jgi:diguanylate cyclase (GGDEF)-like protein
MGSPAMIDWNQVHQALEAMDQGFGVFDREKRLVVCNSRFIELLQLPTDLGIPGSPLGSFFRQGTLPDGDDGSRGFERTGPEGSVLEVKISPLPGGGILASIVDVTRQREAEDQLRQQMMDVQFVRSTVEGQAAAVTAMAEELALQKEAAEEARQKSDYLATHDALTGLPNRRLFIERLEQAVEGAKQAGGRTIVLFIDLDRFKLVNDSLGHERGDALLSEVSARLQQVVRRDDTAARLGGDEFAVVARVAPDDDPNTAHIVGRRIHQALQISVELPEGAPEDSIQTGASIGVAVYPDHGDSADALLAHADSLMYEAKKTGRNRVVMHDGPDHRVRRARG